MMAVEVLAKAFHRADKDARAKLQMPYNELSRNGRVFELLNRAINLNLEMSWRRGWHPGSVQHLEVLQTLSQFQGNLQFPGMAVLLVCHMVFGHSLKELEAIEDILRDFVTAGLLTVSAHSENPHR